MSLFALAFYMPFNQNISFAKYGIGDEAESKMPFRMTQIYVSQMKQIKMFLIDYTFLVVWGFCCGAFTYF